MRKISTTVAAISAEYPEMELYEEDGSVREFITIMRDGRDVAHVDGMATELADGQTLGISTDDTLTFSPDADSEEFLRRDVKNVADHFERKYNLDVDRDEMLEKIRG
jgi:hypothetical protein